jgi:aryl-alcohol dehydrogenase-like predicted oxidoreductase
VGAGRLTLGTAQLGQRYGIANRGGQPSYAEAAAMLDLALAAGVHRLDTAAGYGDAESRIGRYLSERAPEQPPSIVTKLGVGDTREEISLRAALARSRARLGVAPTAVLLHDPELLARWRSALGETLQAVRAEGFVQMIGASVYDPAQFAQALALAGIDIVQAPFSVFDRRLELAGLLEEARRAGVRVMLRSAFLQGLLLLEPGRCPPSLAFAAARLRRWHRLCAAHGLAPAHVALRFVLQRAEDASVVIGCESLTQLGELLDAAAAPPLAPSLVAELEELASTEEALVDPRRW